MVRRPLSVVAKQPLLKRSTTAMYTLCAAGMGAAMALIATGAREQPAGVACEAPSVLALLAQVNERLDRIEKALGVGLAAFAAELQKIKAAQLANPKNLAMKYFDEAYFAGLSSEAQQRLLAIVRSGFENSDSGMGCYAMRPDDYDTFNAFFDPVIRDYHGANADAVHETDWDTSAIGSKGVLDVTKLGLKELSMRVRVGRNLAAFNLPGSMDRDERVRFEQTMLKAFAKLQSMPEYGGTVYSLTPDFGEGQTNPNLISNEKYQELIKAHVMFKDMDADPYLNSAGISADWPYGKRCNTTAAWLEEGRKKRHKGRSRVRCGRGCKLFPSLLPYGSDIYNGLSAMHIHRCVSYACPLFRLSLYVCLCVDVPSL